MGSIEEAFWRAFAGEPGAARDAAAALTGSSPADVAWRAALSALEQNAAGGGPLAIDELAIDEVGLAPRSAEVGRPLALAWDQASRAAFLAHDATAHARCAASLARIDESAGPLSMVLCSLARGRQLALEGDGPALLTVARDLEVTAVAAEIPAAVVEAAALRALGELEVGDVAAAVASARRAARMARTEALPPSELFASCVLARARRFADRPHLAVHILTALARFAPDAWLPWIGWELTLAGATPLARALVGPSDLGGASLGTLNDAPLDAPALDAEGRASVDAPSASHRVARALLDAVDAVDAGDHAGLLRAAARGRAAGAGATTFGRELERVVQASDPGAPLDGAEPALAAWCRGDGVLPPFGLMGLAAGSDGLVALVVATAERAPRRVFARAVALAPTATASSRPGRLETALAVLALGGAEGYDKSGLFQRVYGFPYRREIHEGPFEVLLHRARRAGGDALELERADGRVVARARRPFAVPDPRCAKPLDEQLLRTIALRAGLTAREVADDVRVPLRTVQGALRTLTDEGACLAERRGRHVHYVVEDTTFSEPTRRHERRSLGGADALTSD